MGSCKKRGCVRGVDLPDSFMWSSIISAYAKQGQAKRAIELYYDIQATRMKLDNYLFVAALRACAVAGALQSGKLGPSLRFPLSQSYI